MRIVNALKLSTHKVEDYLKCKCFCHIINSKIYHMKLKFLFRFILVFAIWIFSSSILLSKTLDHELFLKEMEYSSDNVYNKCLKKFDDYLSRFPNDVSVLIEKCKFIQNAQYDDYEDYNPNQNAFDSCVSYLVKKFPDDPEVLIFQTTYLWGDELKNVLDNAEKSIRQNPLAWSKKNQCKIYGEIAEQFYWDKEYQSAYNYILKAINQDKNIEVTIQYARILIELNRKKEALKILLSIEDTTRITWQLNQKADLFIKLEAYSEALEIYNLIDEIDSTFNNNLELANTLEGVGEYDFARSYLVADTNQEWNKEASLRNLLIHDIKYQNGTKCIQTYDEYRDLGYLMDPLGIYRLKIFILHPFQSWKFRDSISILSFSFFLIILILIPSVWILPVYFIGHKWGLVKINNSYKTLWGLKAFWFVSAGYLIASFISMFVKPEILYSIVNSSIYSTELNTAEKGSIALIFIIVFGAFGFAALYKKNIAILLSCFWSIRKSILAGIGILILFRLIIGIYIKIGVYSFNLSLDDIALIPNYFLSFKQDIESIITNYGKLVGFIIICLFAPIYEEIVFRGVIYEACLRYINFISAIIIQAFLFALIHFNLFLFPVFFFFGIIAGNLRRRSGGLLAGIVFHSLNNALAISFLLLR